MTTEEMKAAWNETSRRLDRLEREYFGMRSEVMNTKKKTALQSLATRYKRFSILSMICVFISPFYTTFHYYDSWMRVWLPICMTIFFGICSVMDWWLYKRVSSIDVATMTNEEVLRSSRLCKRRHLQFIAILAPLALGLVALMVISVRNQELAVYSCAIGFVIGLAIGIKQLINFFEDYRMLKDNFSGKDL